MSEGSSSDEDVREGDPVLSFQQEIIDTSDLLKPFSATKKSRRRKGNNKSKLDEEIAASEDKQGK